MVIETARKCGYDPFAVYDDDEKFAGTSVAGAPVAGRIKDLPDNLTGLAFIAIGNNPARKKIASRLKNLTWLTLIHPNAYVCDSVIKGCGTLICAGVVIQPEARIGDHVIINTGAHIDHECIIENYAHVSPGNNLAAGVQIGEGTIMGIGTSVIPFIKIGDWCCIGAGAVVVKDIPANAKAMGVPARICK